MEILVTKLSQKYEQKYLDVSTKKVSMLNEKEDMKNYTL